MSAVAAATEHIGSQLADLESKIGALSSSITALEAERDEHINARNQLQTALKALGAGNGHGAPTPKAKRTTATPRKAQKTNGSSATRRTRGDGGPTRKEQIRDLIKTHPGITAGQIAERLQINQTQPHHILKEFVAAGEAVKVEKGYHPAKA